MIIHQARIDNAWRRAALAWPAAILLACVLAWPALDYLQVSHMRLLPLAIAIPQGAFLLYKLGTWSGPPTRVLAFAAIVGLFGYLPLLAALLVPAVTLLFFDARTGLTLAARAVFQALFVFWVAVNIVQVRALVLKSGFIARELKIDAGRLLLARAPKTSLASIPSAGAWLARLLVFGIPAVYFLQRLANDDAGPRSTLLQVAVLATPIAFYLLGHVARGAYLWLFLVWQLERKLGKPVHLALQNRTMKTT